MADPGFMDRGADILLPPPAPPLLLSSLLLSLIPPLFFLDVQARRGAGAPPAPTLDPSLRAGEGHAHVPPKARRRQGRAPRILLARGGGTLHLARASPSSRSHSRHGGGPLLELARRQPLLELTPRRPPAHARAASATFFPVARRRHDGASGLRRAWAAPQPSDTPSTFQISTMFHNDMQ